MNLTFQQLTPDLHICLCTYLTAKDICSLSQTCSLLQEIYRPESWKSCTVKPNDTDAASEDLITPHRTRNTTRSIPVRILLNPLNYSWFFSQSVKDIIIDSECIDSFIADTEGSNGIISAQSTEALDRSLDALSKNDDSNSSLFSNTTYNSSNNGSSISSSDSSSRTGSTPSDPASTEPSSNGTPSSDGLLPYYSSLQSVHFKSSKRHIEINEVNSMFTHSDFLISLITTGHKVTISLNVDLDSDLEFNQDSSSKVSMTDFYQNFGLLCEAPYLNIVTSLKFTVLKHLDLLSDLPFPPFSNLSTLDLAVSNSNVYKVVLSQLSRFNNLKSFHSSHTCTFRDGGILIDRSLRWFSSLLPPNIEICIIQLFFISKLSMSNIDETDDWNVELLSPSDANSHLVLPQVTHLKCKALEESLPIDIFFSCISFPRLCNFSTPFTFSWNSTTIDPNLFLTVSEVDLFITNTDFHFVFIRFLPCFVNVRFLSVSMSGYSTYSREFDNLNTFTSIVRQYYLDNPTASFSKIPSAELLSVIYRCIPQLCEDTMMAKATAQILVNMIKAPLKFSDKLSRYRTLSQYDYILDAYLWESLFQLLQQFQHLEYLNIHVYGYSHASPRLQRLVTRALHSPFKLKRVLFTQQITTKSMNEGPIDFNTKRQNVISNAPAMNPKIQVWTEGVPEIYLQMLYDMNAIKCYETKLVTHRLLNIKERYYKKSESTSELVAFDAKDFKGWI